MSSYKAEPYKVTTHHDAVTDETAPWDSMPAFDTTETRFRIVSIETGEVLDDAQGYGYKTAQKAYSAYGYKIRDKRKDRGKHAKMKHIKKWMQSNKDFVEAMDVTAFEISKGSWGPDEKFNAKTVKEMLESSGLEPDFTAGELLRVWQKG